MCSVTAAVSLSSPSLEFTEPSLVLLEGPSDPHKHVPYSVSEVKILFMWICKSCRGDFVNDFDLVQTGVEDCITSFKACCFF